MRCFLRRRSRIRTSHPTSESLADRQMFSRLLNLEYTVETGISYHIHILDSDAFQQSLAFLILHEETGKTLQYIGITPAIPLEEYLILAEDTAHTIGRNVAMLQDMKEIRPELILDEESHHRTHQAKETDGIQTGIHRHIADDVGTLIVLAHLITRRRIKGEQNLILRIILADLLHQWTSLLKLAERCCMKPDVLSIRIHLLLQYFESLTLATPHLAYLFIKQTGDGYAQ